MKTALLTTSYFGPVQYFTKFLSYQMVQIEIFENYPRQTYRNRTVIFGANGPLNLSVPVIKPTSPKSKTKEVLVDYTENWQKDHFRGIESAYNRSPFYEFYIDELRFVYDQKFDLLIDLNQKILDTLLHILQIECKISNTKEYLKKDQLSDLHDYREYFHPKPSKKIPDPTFQPTQYFQVFAEKHGFIPNLSILDLLFNEGPNARQILTDSCGFKI